MKPIDLKNLVKAREQLIKTGFDKDNDRNDEQQQRAIRILEALIRDVDSSPSSWENVAWNEYRRRAKDFPIDEFLKRDSSLARLFNTWKQADNKKTVANEQKSLSQESYPCMHDWFGTEVKNAYIEILQSRQALEKALFRHGLKEPANESCNKIFALLAGKYDDIQVSTEFSNLIKELDLLVSMRDDRQQKSAFGKLADKAKNITGNGSTRENIKKCFLKTEGMSNLEPLMSAYQAAQLRYIAAFIAYKNITQKKPVSLQKSVQDPSALALLNRLSELAPPVRPSSGLNSSSAFFAGVEEMKGPMGGVNVAAPQPSPPMVAFNNVAVSTPSAPPLPSVGAEVLPSAPPLPPAGNEVEEMKGQVVELHVGVSSSSSSVPPLAEGGEVVLRTSSSGLGSSSALSVEAPEEENGDGDEMALPSFIQVCSKTGLAFFAGELEAEPKAEAEVEAEAEEKKGSVVTLHAAASNSSPENLSSGGGAGREDVEAGHVEASSSSSQDSSSEEQVGPSP